ncbi:uncharacterized protein [Littorina saxatilis]
MKPTTTTITMNLAALLCLNLLLLQSSVMGKEKDEECFEVCGDYIRWGYDCAMRAKCFQKQQTDENAFRACYEACNSGASDCQDMCVQNYDQLKASCNKKCEDASMMDIFCEDECLEDDFMAQYRSQLPDLTPQDSGIFQGIPGFGDDDEADEEGMDD